MNGLSFILLILIVGYSVFAGIYIYKRKKAGHSFCSGNCFNCSKNCK